ncbi:efflux transporter outer membrane subunit [Limnohabitans sp. Jir72]|uniref:efflux transporter outer membrane subunit n=1 Tax=Limnohabitans sp. Jir72 TaxID=1977909 RepID=UPI001E29F10F|nr:efflux transporter outer membrane subunit [Limnohabitans sp. Jir72]
MKFPPTFSAGRTIALTVSVTAGLVACSTPDTGPTSAALLQAPALGLPEVRTSLVMDAWWQSWRDPQLDALIRQSLQDNPSMATAQARVQRMQALAGVVGAASLPQATLGADFSRQRYSANGLFPKPIAGSVWSNDTAQLNLGWSPDVWGQHAAELASAIGQTRAAQADAAVAANALASQVAHAYVVLARWMAQLAVAERMQQQRQAVQQIVVQRREAGLDTQLDQAQSDSSLSDAQAQVEGLKEQVALTRHQLAALSAQPPHALDGLSPQLSALELEVLPARVGADLLGRRPDVVAALWRVEAAQQDVKQARTQFYPNINLSAFVGFNALGLNQLLDSGSRQYGVTPALRLPLFDGGRLRAQLSGRQAEREMAIAQYNSTVLEAVKETTDAISSSQSVDRQYGQQSLALASAERAHALAQQRYQAGLGNLLAVLSAESLVLSQRRAAIDLKARQLDTRVNLMRALGGGWHDTSTPTAPIARTGL